ncbi:Crp/Fnr family transcriptional regulator [Myroides marinus]|uniref:Crp/Fnr family transcriptional regulator n=1 Tax=Myroides marinus TaxID=703342 RepID=UPI0025752F0A|nr:Crp/Fnr family transcriptional regulator [Myroides marinus]MDM1367129.1 Crp/Fnr family transcriptional regulator [Myroides marinus]MDM1372925.1 Crp/Fnr family transcriptional regulator [Myroides marinus]
MNMAEQYLQTFIEHLRETIELTTSDVDKILEVVEIVKLKRKEFLLTPGQPSRHMRFIAEGSARSYYLDENSQEHTLQIGIENWWINDLYSFLTQKDSQMYIQAIESAVILQISQSNLEKLYREVPEVSTFFRIKIQNAYVALQERMIENLSAEVYIRYQKFIKDYRDIEQRVPQYIVASYLGVTPEFLSYLKKKHL